jgi:tRNA/tmRNA/rRNA uracil-C5-methylase (TrmA/RlmC/RlmD family)
MSSVHAVTEDLKFSVRIASFYEINDAAKQDIVRKVSELMAELGKEHDFLVWRTQFEIYPKEKNGG